MAKVSKAFIAKYRGKCPVCNSHWRPGTDWLNYVDNVLQHVRCPVGNQPALGSTVITASNYQNSGGHNFPQPIIEDTSDAIAEAIEASLLNDEPIAEKTFIPSVYQQAIFDVIALMTQGLTNFKHLVIEAVAGSGKTTTIVEALKLIPIEYKVCFVAFNKHIATPLGKKLQLLGLTNTRASTLHSLGLSNYRKFNPKVKIEEDKLGLILDDFYPVSKKALQQNVITKEERKQNFQKRDGMRRLVAMSKNTMIDYHNTEAVLSIIDRYNLDIEEKYIDELIKLLPDIMETSKKMIDIVDFDDMIWLPVVLNLDLEKFDYLMVDEAQDLNKLQIDFILGSIRVDGHIIAVGDRYQSLYAFRGADADAIPNIISALDAKVLPLSVTYRCPASHVRNAQKIVSHLEARENAPEGEIIQLEYFDLAKTVQNGDMVICRTNVPLVRPAFECIRMGKKAVIRGKDIGSSLVNMIKRFEADDLGQFHVNLMEYYEHEMTKLMNHGKEMKALLLQDKVDTLLLIMDECSSVRELEAKITMLFSDSETGVIFSSVHRAKGLEANRVYILRPDLMPHPKASRDYEVQQEMNAKYVAETRSKDVLAYVIGGENI